jgi:hypothetical protein
MEQEESRGEKRTSGSLFVLARTLHVKKEKEKKTFRSRKLSCFDLIAKEERPGGARKKRARGEVREQTWCRLLGGAGACSDRCVLAGVFWGKIAGPRLGCGVGRGWEGN